MDPMKLYEKFEKMREELGTETLLNELYDAMTTDEAEANLKFIAQNWNLETFKEN